MLITKNVNVIVINISDVIILIFLLYFVAVIDLALCLTQVRELRNQIKFANQA